MLNSRTIVSTPTFLNKSTDPARRPYSNVGDALLQQLHLLLYLYRQKRELLKKRVIVHNPQAS